MAKKIKRKVSQVSAGATVVELMDSHVDMNGQVAAAPRTFNRKANITTEFNPDYGYVVRDLKRIGILAGSFFVLLVALSFIIPMLIK